LGLQSSRRTEKRGIDDSGRQTLQNTTAEKRNDASSPPNGKLLRKNARHGGEISQKKPGGEKASTQSARRISFALGEGHFDHRKGPNFQDGRSIFLGEENNGNKVFRNGTREKGRRLH